jgi:hypothetical protein
MRYTIATIIERERYGICDPDLPLLQFSRSSVLPRSSRMALFQPGADRAYVWQGAALQRKGLSKMYDDNERGAAQAVSDTVSVLRTTQSLWFLGGRRDTNVHGIRFRVIPGRLDGKRKMPCIAVIDQQHVLERISPDESADALIFQSSRKHGYISKMELVRLENEIDIIR